MKLHNSVPNLDFNRILKIFKKILLKNNLSIIIYTLDPNDKNKTQKKTSYKNFKNDNNAENFKNEKMKDSEKNDTKMNDNDIKIKKSELFLDKRILISSHYEKDEIEEIKNMIEKLGGK
jgi:hypothetical protein